MKKTHNGISLQLSVAAGVGGSKNTRCLIGGSILVPLRLSFFPGRKKGTTKNAIGGRKREKKMQGVENRGRKRTEKEEEKQFHASACQSSITCVKQSSRNCIKVREGKRRDPALVGGNDWGRGGGSREASNTVIADDRTCVHVRVYPPPVYARNAQLVLTCFHQGRKASCTVTHSLTLALIILLRILSSFSCHFE